MAALKSVAPARLPCGFCQEAERWPDRCSPQFDEFCGEEIEFRHALEDHRRCDPKVCSDALVVLTATEVGSALAVKEGTAYAVVCTLCEPWEVRPFARLQQAKPFRVGHGKRVHGALASIEAKRVIFVVTAGALVV